MDMEGTHLEVDGGEILVSVELLGHRGPIHRELDDAVVVWHVEPRDGVGEDVMLVETKNIVRISSREVRGNGTYRATLARTSLKTTSFPNTSSSTTFCSRMTRSSFFFSLFLTRSVNILTFSRSFLKSRMSSSFLAFSTSV